VSQAQQPAYVDPGLPTPIAPTPPGYERMYDGYPPGYPDKIPPERPR
jgi:hypothetical protein